jgi:transposase-like protein
VRVGGDATVAAWMERIDRGVTYRVIAMEHGVTPRLVHLRVREMRERMRGAA